MLERDTRLVEQPPNAPDLFDVVRRQFRGNDNVVQGDKGERPSKRGEDEVYCSVKVAGTFFSPNGIGMDL